MEEEEGTGRERERQEKMWVMERITTLSRENEEMKRIMEVIEAKIAQQERMEKEMRERQLMMEAAITQIAQHTQQQNVFNESTKATLNGLVEEVKKHQDLFQETVRVLQNHEQQVVRSGSASQEMAQFINALIQENAKKELWIGALTREAQAQAQVLQQHQMGQQVLAEVVKKMMQPQQPPMMIGGASQPLITDVDEEAERDFQRGPNPHTRPPDREVMEMERPRLPGHMEVVNRL